MPSCGSDRSIGRCRWWRGEGRGERKRHPKARPIGLFVAGSRGPFRLCGDRSIDRSSCDGAVIALCASCDRARCPIFFLVVVPRPEFYVRGADLLVLLPLCLPCPFLSAPVHFCCGCMSSSWILRDVTCAPCLFQANSEHSRHWFFSGKMVIDGVEQKKTLFKLVKETLPKVRACFWCFGGNLGAPRRPYYALLSSPFLFSPLRRQCVLLERICVPTMHRPVVCLPFASFMAAGAFPVFFA